MPARSRWFCSFWCRCCCISTADSRAAPKNTRASRARGIGRDRSISGAGLLDQLATVPLVFPGIVLGVAMMEISLRSPIPLYGTLWVIMLAFLIRYMPYGMRYAYAGVLQIHRELEEAAGVAGASPLGT